MGLLDKLLNLDTVVLKTQEEIDQAIDGLKFKIELKQTADRIVYVIQVFGALYKRSGKTYTSKYWNALENYGFEGTTATKEADIKKAKSYIEQYKRFVRQKFSLEIISYIDID